MNMCVLRGMRVQTKRGGELSKNSHLPLAQLVPAVCQANYYLCIIPLEATTEHVCLTEPLVGH